MSTTYLTVTLDLRVPIQKFGDAAMIRLPLPKKLLQFIIRSWKGDNRPVDGKKKGRTNCLVLPFPSFKTQDGTRIP